MPTRPTKDIYSSQASEVDARMTATIKAANELQRKTKEIDKQRQGSIQAYHQRRSELKQFLAGLYTDSGVHGNATPSEGVRDGRSEKREKKTQTRGKDDGQRKRHQSNQTTAAKFLSGGSGGLNGLGLPTSDDATESSSDDDSDYSEIEQSDDLKRSSERENKDDDENCCKTRRAGPKLPKIINARPNARRRFVPDMGRKFDIALFRRRFSHFSRCVDERKFIRTDVDCEDGDGLRPPPLTRSTLASLDSKPNHLHAKIQQWCDSIGEGWFCSASKDDDDDLKSKPDETVLEMVERPKSNCRKGVPDSQDMKTNENQFLHLPSWSLSRSISHQISPLPPSSQSRSRRSSHAKLPRTPRNSDRSKRPSESVVDDRCEIELVDGGFGLDGTRVVKKASLPVSSLIKEIDRAGDHLVPGNRNHIDKRVHFAVDGGEVNNVSTTRLGSLPRPKSQDRSQIDAGVELEGLEFEVKLTMRSDTTKDGTKVWHHSYHECKVYRGRDRAISLADPLTLDRQARAQTRVVQRQRDRMRRESYTYSTNASNDAALKYDLRKWSL